jgi:hypothetical protein
MKKEQRKGQDHGLGKTRGIRNECTNEKAASTGVNAA